MRIQYLPPTPAFHELALIERRFLKATPAHDDKPLRAFHDGASLDKRRLHASAPHLDGALFHLLYAEEHLDILEEQVMPIKDVGTNQ